RLFPRLIADAPHHGDGIGIERLGGQLHSRSPCSDCLGSLDPIALEHEAGMTIAFWCDALVRELINEASTPALHSTAGECGRPVPCPVRARSGGFCSAIDPLREELNQCSHCRLCAPCDLMGALSGSR